jgi:hypothetical protein
VWQTAPNAGWGGWDSLGSPPGVHAAQPRVARNADGRLEVFARGTDNALWHLWQTSANGSWTTGSAFAGATLASSPDAAPNADGRLEVFWRAPGGNVETNFQKVGGGWSAVVDFGGNVTGL